MRKIIVVLAASAASLFAQVRINEVCADNSSTLLTKAGTASDWIELYNAGSDPVDLGGWFLSDAPAEPRQWRFPEGTQIGPEGYLIVFADSSPNEYSITNGELHANFSLGKDGEHISLCSPDDVTVDAYSFGRQFSDGSYGYSPKEQTLINSSSRWRFRIPTVSGPGDWNAATGSVGFVSEQGSFTVKYYEMAEAMTGLVAAEALLKNPSKWKTDRTYPVVSEYETLNFCGAATSVGFPNEVPFPTHTTISQGKDWFVVTAEGAIFVPEAGLWTFAVGSDDGFRLSITGHGVDFSSEFPNNRGYGQSLATFSFPVAGVYSVNLLYWENTGGASCELSAAQGWQESFNTNMFRLVGDANGGLAHAGAFGTLIKTDAGPQMINVNPRLDGEWRFVLNELPAADDHVLLKIRAADGFSVLLNGTALAAFNFPSDLVWNSCAVGRRSSEVVPEPFEYVVPAGLLKIGENLLTATVLNDSISDGDFFFEPSLTWRTAQEVPLYFKTATPGAANSSQGYLDPMPVTEVSEKRGYKNAPFMATLSGPVGFDIHYTLDGSTPGTTSPLYVAPFEVSKTTILRTCIPNAESIYVPVTTVSWIFISDVLQQSSNPPTGWSTNVNGQVFEFGMNPGVATTEESRIRQGFTNEIPTFSIAINLDDLIGPQKGIYVNPNNDGRGWEREVSLELIDPVRGEQKEFQIGAGLRIRGAASRTQANPKHSFRLFFRSEYGAGKLNFPLFEEEGVGSFDKFDLRCSQNYSWSYGKDAKETFIRDVFSRDTQRDMGMPYTRSRAYHLYINGIYWGLYETQERAEAEYAASYLGGISSDWDALKTSNPGRVTTAVDGSDTAFRALWDAALNKGFADPADYLRMKGLNPDRTRNPDYPVYLDEQNLMARMLLGHFTGDPDSPISAWGAFPNNMFILYNHTVPGGFKYFCHDSEHSLGANSGYPVSTDVTSLGSTFTTFEKFNPSTLHQALATNAEYRLRFADLVQKQLFGSGALTEAKNRLRWEKRMTNITCSVTAESARWGRGTKFHSTWLSACSYVLGTYFPQRRDYVIRQYREKGWYPKTDAPTASIYDQQVPSGTRLHLLATNSIYYTTDGSDPRRIDGSVNPAAAAVTVPFVSDTFLPEGSAWHYYDLGAEPAANNGCSWKEPGYNTAAWSSGSGLFGFAGSGTTNRIATRTRRYVDNIAAPQVTTTYFRRSFTVDAAAYVAAISARMLCDDGVVIYLNGAEAFRLNMPAGATDYATYASSTVGPPLQNTYVTYQFPASLLADGENVIAVELHQCNAVSTDLYFDLALSGGGTANGSTYLATELVTSNQVVSARAFNNGEWSALTQTELITDPPPPPDYSKLRVSTFMYAPPPPVPGKERDSNGSDTYAFIELANTGTQPLDVGGCYFFGIVAELAPRILAPGEKAILPKSVAFFADRYGTPETPFLSGWTSGNFSRSGERVVLYTPDGAAIFDFTYSDAWYPETKNTGRWICPVDLFGSAENLQTKEGWMASNPGEREARYGGLHISKIMYCGLGNKDNYDFLEILNAGDTDLDLTGFSVAGITYVFPSFALRSGTRCCLVKSAANFASRYPTQNVSYVQWTSGNLADSGEEIELCDSEAARVAVVNYTAACSPLTTSTGRCLVAVDLTAESCSSCWSAAAAWRPSEEGSVPVAGAPETPSVTRTGFSDAASSEGRKLLLDVKNLDGLPEVWFTENLMDWRKVPPGLLKREGSSLSVDLSGGEVGAGPQGFFQIRQK